MSGPRIALAGAAEAATLARLHRHCFAAPWDEATIAAMITAPGGFALLAGPPGRETGFALLRVVAAEGEVLSLGVVPASRRRGLGRAIVAAAIAEAERRGAARLLLEVAVANAAGRRLYAAAGFRPLARRTNYYGRGGDALLMGRGSPPA